MYKYIYLVALYINYTAYSIVMLTKMSEMTNDMVEDSTFLIESSGQCVTVKIKTIFSHPLLFLEVIRTETDLFN